MGVMGVFDRGISIGYNKGKKGIFYFSFEFVQQLFLFFSQSYKHSNHILKHHVMSGHLT